MVHPVNQVMTMGPNPESDLNILITATIARVDQLAAEHQDPETSEARKKEIHDECLALYKACRELQAEYERQQGQPPQ